MTVPSPVRLAWLALLSVVLSGANGGVVAWGQIAAPEVDRATGRDGDLAVVLERGSKLEQQRRWAEAMNHYEEALRMHPQRTDLSERLHVARKHYDVCRRYADSTFITLVGATRDRDALTIYDEVLTKVNTHFVQVPDWQDLFRRGTTQLLVACSEPPFKEKHLSKLSDQQRVALEKYILQLTTDRKVTDRQQAVEGVDLVARALAQYFQVPQPAVVFEYTAGAAGSLDDYSSFLTGSQMDEVFTQIEGNFVGLGVELKTEDSALVIVNVIEQGPAFVGGIRTGDRIVAVDGHTTKEKGLTTDSMADMLRGQEGSLVAISVVHADGKREELTLTRRRVEVPSVDKIKLIDEAAGVGYFRITSFQKTTARDVDAALWKLHGMGMKSLVIDLRGNPGGLLKAAVEVADKFVMDGMIVATRGREDYDHRGQVAGTWRVPLVVLIDKDSASASEILAGAIQDHHRGTLVGERSYGKGSVQGIFPLNASSAGVRLTTAKWFTPSGQPITGHGVTPDVIVAAAATGTSSVSEPNQIAIDAKQPPDAILRSGLETARSHLTRQATAASGGESTAQ
jgi:carboxyl-terminal processing protease